MGKKNIKPNLNQPVIRFNVAKAALEGLTEENLTTATAPHPEGGVGPVGLGQICFCINCSYDGDDAE